jgi:hypothetical protein
MKYKMAVKCAFAMTWSLACISLAVLAMPLTQIGTPPPSVTAPALDQLKAEHQRVLDELNGKGENGRPLELDDPRVPEILKKGWGLAGAWAAAYLETHSTPSAGELEQIFEGFAPEPRGVKSLYGDFLEYHEYRFEGGAVRIGTAIYVVWASYSMWSSTGDFMIVARNPNGHFQALWNIKDLAEKHYAQKDEIGRWVFLVRRAYYNGPLDVSKVLPLSPAANGHARFLVDANQSADGGTALAQLSIWEWDEAEAKPLLVKLYHYAVGYSGFHFDGTTLRITTKEELETLHACGMCPEPRGIWTVRVTPDGVHDLGHRFEDPEIQWADELLSKIAKGKDTTDLADPKVVATINAYVKKVQAEEKALDPSPGSDFSWGLLDKYHILQRGRQGAFEVGLDEGHLRFRYVLREGKPYFTDVRIKCAC